MSGGRGRGPERLRGSKMGEAIEIQRKGADRSHESQGGGRTRRRRIRQHDHIKE